MLRHPGDVIQLNSVVRKMCCPEISLYSQEGCGDASTSNVFADAPLRSKSPDEASHRVHQTRVRKLGREHQQGFAVSSSRDAQSHFLDETESPLVAGAHSVVSNSRATRSECSKAMMDVDLKLELPDGNRGIAIETGK